MKICKFDYWDPETEHYIEVEAYQDANGKFYCEVTDNVMNTAIVPPMEGVDSAEEIGKELVEIGLRVPQGFVAELAKPSNPNDKERRFQIFRRFPIDVEIRGLKVSLSLSEETYAFTGNLYISNKRCAQLQNHGTGGSTMVWPTNDDARDLIRRVKEFLIELDEEGTPDTLTDSVWRELLFDSMISHIVDRHVRRNEAKRITKNNKVTTYQLEEDWGKPTYYTIDIPYNPLTIRDLAARFPDQRIRFLNADCAAVPPFHYEWMGE